MLTQWKFGEQLESGHVQRRREIRIRIWLQPFGKAALCRLSFRAARSRTCAARARKESAFCPEIDDGREVRLTAGKMPTLRSCFGGHDIGCAGDNWQAAGSSEVW